MNRRISGRGFTILELLIVIAIVATMMGMAVNVLGDSYREEVKTKAARLSALLEFCYNESVTRRVPIRIVFDLTEQEYWVEENAGTFLLQSDKERENVEKLLKQTSPSKTKKKDENSEKDSEASSASDDKAPPAPADFVPVDDNLAKKVRFKQKVRLRDIQVAHQEGALSDGRAYLYFFPAGFTEKALIHLSNEDGERPYSIIVNPMTGHGKIVADEVDYKDLDEM